MTLEELKLEYREDPNHQDEKECPTWQVYYWPHRRGCQCNLPWSMALMTDQLKREVKVGDKVVAVAKTTSPGLKIREITEFTWHRVGMSYSEGEESKSVTYLKRRAKVKGLVDSRDGKHILLIAQLNCDGCGKEKHRHDMMVICGDCSV